MTTSELIKAGIPAAPPTPGDDTPPSPVTPSEGIPTPLPGAGGETSALEIPASGCATPSRVKKTTVTQQPAPPPQPEVSLGFRLLMGVFAMFGGISTAIAVNIGAVFSEYTKDPLRSTCIHFIVSTTCMVTICMWKKTWRDVHWEQLKPPHMKWWYVPMPGLFGSTAIAASIALTPQVTFGTFIGFFVFGQVATSLLCDHFAVLGTAKNPLTWPRVLVTVAICAAVGISEGFNPSQAKHSWWATLLMCVTCVIAGILPPFQALFNKAQSERYGSPFTGAAVSYMFGTIWLGFISLLSLTWSPVESNITEAPWYVWFSGLLAPVFVVSTCICPRYLGASLFFVSVVVGQLGMSIIIDATKLFPDNARDVTWVRCVCIVIVAIGVAIKNILHEKQARASSTSSSSTSAAPSPLEGASPKEVSVDDEEGAPTTTTMEMVEVTTKSSPTEPY